LQFADAFQCGLIGDQAVAHAHAHVAQHGRVGQVTLPAGNRQFLCHVGQHRVGQAEVAFGVFKVNRVDLVRHGGRAHFTGNGALLKVAVGNISPDITVKIDQDGVVTGEGIEQLGDVIVRFNLGGVGVEGQAQRGDEFLRVGSPVDGRIGRDVGVVVTHGAVDFAQYFHRADLFDLTLKTCHHVGHFFAQG